MPPRDGIGVTAHDVVIARVLYRSVLEAPRTPGSTDAGFTMATVRRYHQPSVIRTLASHLWPIERLWNVRDGRCCVRLCRFDPMASFRQ